MLRRGIGVAVAALITLGLIGLALTGKSPGNRELSAPAPRGLIAAPPTTIEAIELRRGQVRASFRRLPSGSWVVGRQDQLVPADLALHLDNALQFMFVSEPARTLNAADLRDANFAEFGLDAADLRVTLTKADGSTAVVNFGALNPASTSQYARLVGRPTLYLLPRHVGAEWEVAADLATRLPRAPEDGEQGDLRQASSWLLPVSIARAWSVEIVLEGRLHRLERDGAGNWLLHTGQHSHAEPATVHIADPGRARLIASALAAFDQARIESIVAGAARPGGLEQFGLARPMMIALLYARDNSNPLVRIEFGDLAPDGFGRYARVGRSNDVVTIAAFEANRLVELLKKLGALT
jgi:hypothetical protein